MTLPYVRLFLLGGTITMTSDSDTGSGVVPTLDAASLCQAVPGLDQVAQVEAETCQMLASSNLTYAHAISLARDIQAAAESGDVDGFVVVQGTDTIEETAFVLECLLDIPQPIVVTGAMRNPSQVSADGPANLLSAVTCAASKSVGLAGVVVVLNDDIHSARFVTKSHTGNVGAFQAANMGPIGRVVEGRARLFTVPVAGPKIALPENISLPKVALVKVSYGDDGYLLNLVAGSDCQAVVIEGFGAGHVPETYLDMLDQMLPKMPIVLSSRIVAGHVLRDTYGFLGSEIDLIKRGLIPSGILDGVKAKILLTLLLMSGYGSDEIQAVFEQWDF